MNEITGEQRGPLFPDLIGASVVDVEVRGGSKYGNYILFRFNNGKTFHIEAQINVSHGGIRPQMVYGVGAWFGMEELSITTEKSPK